MEHIFPDEDELDELGLLWTTSSEWAHGGMCAEFRLREDRGWRFTVWRNWEGARFTWTAYRHGVETYRGGFHGLSLFVRGLIWASRQLDNIDEVARAAGL